MSDENEPQPDCGCDGKPKRGRSAADMQRMRDKRNRRRTGADAFKGVVRDLTCLCRDAFGNVYECPCGPSQTTPTDPKRHP